MALKMKRAERLVEICLDGSLYAEWQSVNEAYKLAKAELSVSSNTSASSPEAKRVRALESQATELSKRAESETAIFRLRALPRAAWDHLVTQNLREDGKPEERTGFIFDRHKITDAALAADGTIVEVTKGGTPIEFSPSDWRDFSNNELSASQYEDFQVAVLSLNGGTNEVPFFRGSKRTAGSVKK